MEKIKVNGVIVVEGKYDKIKLSSFIDGVIITTNGFSLFSNDGKKALIRKLSANQRIIILTDSDGAGLVIRNKIKNLAGKDADIINLYTPKISGKEKRKNKPSKEGSLGVEGIDAEMLREIFFNAGLLSDLPHESKKHYTKADLFALGLSGTSDSQKRRSEILSANALPTDMSANAFLEAVNLIGIELN